ncbi:SPOR domain-containing protein [Sphingomonas sp. AOB5]|uniref:SPOR domain-containing protein n=1 Tax=Sphingomonas sp. AOB5 TaxID=3034017 RepID=UPI0023F83559|nr:SPOR domain-containing protein [Sphingomonas sp. AOB5]MDF7773938.1 SPOR domain-containing protein [Sphingomonas sp. AOB5]
MRSNASIVAVLFLLSGCGGGFGYGPETLPAAQPAPQGYGSAYQAPQDTYREPEPAPSDPYSAQAQQGGYERPDAGYDTPGASYGRPGERVAQRTPAPQPTRRPVTQQPVVQQPQPQLDGWQDPTTGVTDPAASSTGRNEARYDKVGYAGVRGVQGGDTTAGAVVAISPTLPAGSFVEITSLDSGKTILALVTGTGGDGDTLIDLSPAAARQLGASGNSIPVRVRKSTPTGPDQNALNSGQAATPRPDTPPVLLNALRKQLPAYTPARATAPAPAYGRPSTAPVRTAPTGRGRYFVQVAALSNGANANNLAQSLGGFVKQGGGLYRVQLGPFATPAEADRARASAAQRGFGDARVFTQN